LVLLLSINLFHLPLLNVHHFIKPHQNPRSTALELLQHRCGYQKNKVYTYSDKTK
jgi:hypothetical protein